MQLKTRLIAYFNKHLRDSLIHDEHITETNYKTHKLVTDMGYV